MATLRAERGCVGIRLLDGMVALEVGNEDRSDTITIYLSASNARQIAENILAAVRAAEGSGS